MVQKTQVQIPLSDIGKVGFGCYSCHAQSTVDLRIEQQREGAKAPGRKCPVCGTEFRQSLPEALCRIADFIKAAGEADHNVHLVIDG